MIPRDKIWLRRCARIALVAYRAGHIDEHELIATLRRAQASVASMKLGVAG